MAFMAAMLQKQSFMSKQNECSFKLMLLQNQKQTITEAQTVLDKDKDKDMLATLANEEEKIDLEIENLDDQMTLLDSNIKSLQSLVGNNIQQDSTWWAVSGG